MRTLRQDGWRKVLQRPTTVDEVVRAAKADHSLLHRRNRLAARRQHQMASRSLARASLVSTAASRSATGRDNCTMPDFAYTARDMTGQKVTGTLSARPSAKRSRSSRASRSFRWRSAPTRPHGAAAQRCGSAAS